MIQIIPTWSFSRIQDFEQCKHRAKLKYLDKIPEPERPLPPGKTEHANDRGTRIHDAAERFVRGGIELIPELQKFKTEFEKLKALFAAGKVSLEGEWAMDRGWAPVAWKSSDAWLRLKLDAMVMLSKTEAVVIDYKGLPLDTPLPTPTGWTTMGAIQEGQQLLDREGKPCTVIGKSTVKTLPCYRIVFDDTSEVICDEEHRWTLVDGTVLPITELHAGDLIPTTEPLQLPEQELVLDPYVLGIWLADGKHTSGEISKPDEFIWGEIKRRGFEVSHDYYEGTSKCRTSTVKGLRGKLGYLGLLGDKQIPANYLRGSFQQRLDLLRGLMDGDGSANHTRKQAVINTTNKDFAEQIKELLLSLGQRPLLSPYTAHGFGKQVQAYAVSFRPRGINPFLLPRKANKVLPSWGVGEAWRRRILRIELLPARQTQCVMVDSSDHTFLCSLNFVPTHNTGRRFGNEVKHAEQTQLYQLVTFLRYPELETIHTELWYPDVDELATMTYTRNQGLRFKRSFEQRGDAMTTCIDFPANPNIFSCRWCPYKGTDHCDKGVQ